MFHFFTSLLLCFVVVFTPVVASKTAPVNYDIVYVRQPRAGDDQHIKWPEAFRPAQIQAGADLILLHPDGSEEVLVDAKHGAVTDPFISFDAKWVYYSYFPDLRQKSLNRQRFYLPELGADIYKINLKTRKKQRLTRQEFTPNTGSGDWDENDPVAPKGNKNYLGYGILNLSPAPIAGGKIVFTSNRNGFIPPKNYTYPTMQLFVMDENGENVSPIAPMTLSSVLHPVPLKNGTIMFSSYESQGLRDERLWGLWSIYPDGRHWNPILSAFNHASVFHFSTQLSDETIVVEDYYNKNNFGFGTLYGIPALHGNNYPAFNSAIRSENPKVEQTIHGELSTFSAAFSPKGLYALTPSSTASDQAATPGLGKYTHPSAAPNNDLLVVWSDGPVNALKRPWPFPAVDSGIYMIDGADPVYDPRKLILVKNDPNYNEAWPRAVVPYSAIYGVDEPQKLDWLPDAKNVNLPAGTAYGLIGTASFYNRETAPGVSTPDMSSDNAMDVFNTSANNQSANWVLQGADAGLYADDDIWAVRILAMEPFTNKGYGPGSHYYRPMFFYNHANERLRILGEIPLRKWNQQGKPILDYTGKPDTSFLAKIPADTPFTFQTIDKNGSVLNMAQTWHQVRPGEVRTDCGGCHAHSKTPVDFSQTAAAQADYKVWDLANTTPLISADKNGHPSVKTKPSPLINIEFYQDIRPLLQQHCSACHTSENAEKNGHLVLNDTSYTTSSVFPQDYINLCLDESAKNGITPLIKTEDWRQNNASRYVRKFQSRRSLLVWKLFGKRMDGWANHDFPTESEPGVRASLPEGAKVNEADLDYVGSIMPPIAAGKLSMDEKMTFVRWIDIGCPIDTSSTTEQQGFGWFLDETRPTLHLSIPEAGANTSALQTIRFSVADAYTGIDDESLIVTADFTVNGIKAGRNLANQFKLVDEGIYELPLQRAIQQLNKGELFISIADKQGNITKLKRVFSINKTLY